MSCEYQNIKKENSEISKIILDSFYKYNREKKQKMSNIEIKDFFYKKNNESSIVENKEKKLIRYPKERWYEKIINKIKSIFHIK